MTRWNNWTRLQPMQFEWEDEPQLRAVRLVSGSGRVDGGAFWLQRSLYSEFALVRAVGHLYRAYSGERHAVGGADYGAVRTGA